MTVEDILKENARRMKAMYTGFNPLTGEGAPPYDRVELRIEDFPVPVQQVPQDMMQNRLVAAVAQCGSMAAFIRTVMGDEPTELRLDELTKELCRIRSRHDFAFWCYMFVKIKPKEGGEMIRFRLRHEQRVLLREMEDMRLRHKPIRVILLKARQWGGSTMVQIYMAWIQLLHRTGWYSTIIAQTKDVSYKIMAMYEKLLENYPSWMLDLDDDIPLRFSQYGKSKSDFKVTYQAGAKSVTARDVAIQIGTYVEPDNVRGGDVALIHYSEVGVWKETRDNSPERMIRSVSGGLLEKELTVEVLESTANGTGNYFHREWVSAKRGESNRRPVFVPFYFIEHDYLEPEDEEAFAAALLKGREDTIAPDDRTEPGAYIWRLWERGATLGAINWYIHKRKSYNNHADMASEAPADDVEAFKHSGRRVFDVEKVDAMRTFAVPPIACGEVQGDAVAGARSLLNVRFNGDRQGALRIWSYPDKERHIKNDYLVVVDVGGRSRASDPSVIYVLDRAPMLYGGVPETAAEWHGHADHDLLAWKAAQIATFYNNALLVIESNTLETRDKERDTEGLHTAYILDEIGEAYPRLYFRTSQPETVGGAVSRLWGFHTNVSTKPLIIDHLVAAVREQAWVEKCADALDELDWYERKDNGSMGAISGQHDDRVMTRAIALHISSSEMEMPVEEQQRRKVRPQRVGSAAAI